MASPSRLRQGSALERQGTAPLFVAPPPHPGADGRASGAARLTARTSQNTSRMAVHHAQPSIRESSGWGEESASPAPRKPRGAGLAGPARAAFREAGPGDEGSDAADLEESLEDHVSSAMDHQVESEPSMGVPPSVHFSQLEEQVGRSLVGRGGDVLEGLSLAPGNFNEEKARGLMQWVETGQLMSKRDQRKFRARMAWGSSPRMPWMTCRI